jgi:hypothetical protein
MGAIAKKIAGAEFIVYWLASNDFKITSTRNERNRYLVSTFPGETGFDAADILQGQRLQQTALGQRLPGSLWMPRNTDQIKSFANANSFPSAGEFGESRSQFDLR